MNPCTAVLLVGLGVSELSVGVQAVGPVKARLRNLSAEEAQGLPSACRLPNLQTQYGDCRRRNKRISVLLCAKAAVRTMIFVIA